MYQIEGAEFSSLIRREFSNKFVSAEQTGKLEDQFMCKSRTVRDQDFALLNFSSDFIQGLQVNHMEDTTHVSLHFQLSGQSEAHISGFKDTVPIKAGHFNLLNCVDPVSTFIFPKQRQYEYLCLGLNPVYFQQTLLEAGTEFERVLEAAEKKKSFRLFPRNRPINTWQQDILQRIKNPPVIAPLQFSYIRSMVQELTLITLSQYPENHQKPSSKPDLKEQEQLHAIKDFLAEHYLADLSLQGISRTFFLNEFKLKSGFKKLFGTTVFGYVQQLRMEKAHILLTSGGYRVGEVAAIVGFSSDAAFIRSFRQHYGHSPGKLKSAGTCSF
ncbi:AraC-like DNA-binding protein [Pedobacter nutrimenti]|jgi:AraC-like DNA-binding protein|uniref:AraC-like DNA-binding protein n=2 Tax=Pedobacter nutrimenti TaxID=1241337 RepID=A0A318UP45_9SPHI|nr:AraC-like DNA-binding protein [Pedobacter nutrimenti]